MSMTILKGRPGSVTRTVHVDPAFWNPDRAAQADPNSTRVDRKALADQIILAGKRRRGEIADDPPPLDPRAAAILKAGRLRRGEEE
jgi:hypothetical protein